MLKKSSKIQSPKEVNAEQLSQNIAKRIDKKKGAEIIIFDLRNISPITDYFVIANGLSGIHNRTIAEYLMEDEKPDHVEGLETGNWILLDFFFNFPGQVYYVFTVIAPFRYICALAIQFPDSLFDAFGKKR